MIGVSDLPNHLSDEDIRCSDESCSQSDRSTLSLPPFLRLYRTMMMKSHSGQRQNLRTCVRGVRVCIGIRVFE